MGVTSHRSRCQRLVPPMESVRAADPFIATSTVARVRMYWHVMAKRQVLDGELGTRPHQGTAGSRRRSTGSILALSGLVPLLVAPGGRMAVWRGVAGEQPGTKGGLSSAARGSASSGFRLLARGSEGSTEQVSSGHATLQGTNGPHALRVWRRSGEPSQRPRWDVRDHPDTGLRSALSGGRHHRR